MVLSIIGHILVVYVKMISGLSIGLLANTGWIAYNVHIGEYSSATLLAIFSGIFIFGIHKHTCVYIERIRLESPDEDQITYQV